MGPHSPKYPCRLSCVVASAKLLTWSVTSSTGARGSRGFSARTSTGGGTGVPPLIGTATAPTELVAAARREPPEMELRALDDDELDVPDDDDEDDRRELMMD
jgi:hypothetical protein